MKSFDRDEEIFSRNVFRRWENGSGNDPRSRKKKQALDRNLVVNAIDLTESRLRELRSIPGVNAVQALSPKIAKDTDVLVLSVKPQHAKEALETVAKHGLKSDCVVISVIAGLPIDKMLEAKLGTESVVRAMPNTPATVGRAATVWMSSPQLTEEQIERTKLILKSSEFKVIF